MRVKDVLLLFLMLSVAPTATVSAQSINPELDTNIASIKHLYRVTDTIRVNKRQLVIKLRWMGKPIEVRVTERVEYDLDEVRKFRKDSTFIPTRLDSINSMKVNENFTQNCHSFALEKYFQYHKIAGNLIFNKNTVLIENNYMKIILEAAFKKTKTISTKSSKNFKTKFENGSLLVFRNKYGWTIHTVFVNDVFYTKNGGGPALTANRLEPIFKIYRDTKTIEEYQLDEAKVKDYVPQE